MLILDLFGDIYHNPKDAAIRIPAAFGMKYALDVGSFNPDHRLLTRTAVEVSDPDYGPVYITKAAPAVNLAAHISEELTIVGDSTPVQIYLEMLYYLRVITNERVDNHTPDPFAATPIFQNCKLFNCADNDSILILPPNTHTDKVLILSTFKYWNALT